MAGAATKARIPVKVPSVGGLKSAAGDFLVGAGGGILVSLSKLVFGTGIFGSLLSAGLAGSVVKGPRGQILATVAGYNAFANPAVGPTASADEPAEEEDFI